MYGNPSLKDAKSGFGVKISRSETGLSNVPVAWALHPLPRHVLSMLTAGGATNSHELFGTSLIPAMSEWLVLCIKRIKEIIVDNS